MKTILLTTLMTLSTIGLAADYRGCTSDEALCASVHSDSPLASVGENKFTVEIQSQAQAVVTKIDLWMQMGSHGHGSAPLKYSNVDENHFAVSRAFFPMKGLWQIRVMANHLGASKTVIVPVQIND